MTIIIVQYCRRDPGQVNYKRARGEYIANNSVHASYASADSSSFTDICILLVYQRLIKLFER